MERVVGQLGIVTIVGDGGTMTKGNCHMWIG
jgi:hypothetical protein